jgi:hypothetical protein
MGRRATRVGSARTASTSLFAAGLACLGCGEDEVLSQLASSAGGAPNSGSRTSSGGTAGEGGEQNQSQTSGAGASGRGGTGGGGGSGGTGGGEPEREVVDLSTAAPRRQTTTGWRDGSRGRFPEEDPNRCIVPPMPDPTDETRDCADSGLFAWSSAYPGAIRPRPVQAPRAPAPRALRQPHLPPPPRAPAPRAWPWWTRSASIATRPI